MGEKKIKSVHLTNYYHKTSGGISTAYNRLLDAAQRHERYVRLIVPGEDDAVEEIGEYGKIYYVKANPAPVFDKRYRLLLPFHYIKGDSPIRKILKAELPDMIEIGEKYTLSLLAGLIKKGNLKELNRPMLVHFSCERMDDNLRAFVSAARPFRWFSRRLIGNYIHPMFDFHLANSDYTSQEVRDAVSEEKNPHRSKAFFNYCHRFFCATELPTSERVFVNQCGADTKHFSDSRKSAEARAAISADAGFPDDATILLYAGRISPEKNVRFLPELFRSLLDSANGCDYRFLIAGDGPMKARLEEDFGKLAAGQFHFTGHITDHDKLADLYANSDVFVHPNPREPFGIGPLEAMASGLPVVAPNSGGVLSYATAANSWLSEPTVDGFSSAINSVMSDDTDRERRKSAAKLTAERYSWENSTDNLFGLYDRMYADFRARQALYVPASPEDAKAALLLRRTESDQPSES